MPRAHLPKLSAQLGRPCPRVQLEAENIRLGGLAMMALQPEAWGWAVGLLFARTPLSGQSEYLVLWRITNAISSDVVQQRMERKRAEALAAAKREAESKRAPKKAVKRPRRGRRPRRR